MTEKLPASIILTGVLRRRLDWNEDLTKWLREGDFVDRELEEHFLEVLPPAFFNSTLIQMGESADSFGENGKPRWLTIQRHHSGQWVYTGPRMLRESVILVEHK